MAQPVLKSVITALNGERPRRTAQPTATPRTPATTFSSAYRNCTLSSAVVAVVQDDKLTVSVMKLASLMEHLRTAARNPSTRKEGSTGELKTLWPMVFRGLADSGVPLYLMINTGIVFTEEAYGRLLKSGAVANYFAKNRENAPPGVRAPVRHDSVREAVGDSVLLFDSEMNTAASDMHIRMCLSVTGTPAFAARLKPYVAQGSQTKTLRDHGALFAKYVTVADPSGSGGTGRPASIFTSPLKALRTVQEALKEKPGVAVPYTFDVTVTKAGQVMSSFRRVTEPEKPPVLKKAANPGSTVTFARRVVIDAYFSWFDRNDTSIGAPGYEIYGAAIRAMHRSIQEEDPGAGITQEMVADVLMSGIYFNRITIADGHYGALNTEYTAGQNGTYGEGKNLAEPHGLMMLYFLLDRLGLRQDPVMASIREFFENDRLAEYRVFFGDLLRGHQTRTTTARASTKGAPGAIPAPLDRSSRRNLVALSTGRTQSPAAPARGPSPVARPETAGAAAAPAERAWNARSTSGTAAARSGSPPTQRSASGEPLTQPTPVRSGSPPAAQAASRWGSAATASPGVASVPWGHPAGRQHSGSAAGSPPTRRWATGGSP